MRIVIDIPEAAYKLLQSDEGVDWLGAEHILHAVSNGTPLPKGHGRLKDVDAFITKVNADRKHSAYLRSWTADDVLNALDNNYAPTIIEADTESEDNV